MISRLEDSTAITGILLPYSILDLGLDRGTSFDGFITIVKIMIHTDIYEREDRFKNFLPKNSCLKIKILGQSPSYLVRF